MKELFKWMACHPDVILTITHDRYTPCRDHGGILITMKHKSWCIQSQQIVLFDLIDIAIKPNDMLIGMLDLNYTKLIEEKNKSIDQCIDEILEVHNENLEY